MTARAAEPRLSDRLAKPENQPSILTPENTSLYVRGVRLTTSILADLKGQPYKKIG